MPITNFEKCNTHIFVFCSLVSEGEEENAGKYFEKENICSAEEVKIGKEMRRKFNAELRNNNKRKSMCEEQFALSKVKRVRGRVLQ